MRIRSELRLASRLKNELVKFAGQVGSILRDLPDDLTPEHRYAFYM
jgi:hypothetical protein